MHNTDKFPDFKSSEKSNEVIFRIQLLYKYRCTLIKMKNNFYNKYFRMYKNYLICRRQNNMN